jgi:hypothetical protein
LKAAQLALRPTDPENSLAEARKDHAQDAFLREVDDALREQQILETLKRNTWPLIGGIAAVLLGLGGFLFWKDSREAARSAEAEKLILAMDRIEAGNAAGAANDLDALIKDGGAAGVLARLTRAGTSIQAGRNDEAARDFAAVAADGSAPQPLRELATVREVALNFEKLQPQQVIDKLKPLAVPGNPWFGSAGELTAMAHLKMGNKELAGPLLVAVAKDKQAPESLKGRVRALAGMLGYDSIDDVAEVAGILEADEAAGAAAPASQEAAKQ